MSGTRKKQSSFSDSLPVQIGLGFSSAGTSTVSPGLSGVEMGHALAREDVDAFLEAVVDMRAARRFAGLDWPDLDLPHRHAARACFAAADFL